MDSVDLRQKIINSLGAASSEHIEAAILAAEEIRSRRLSSGESAQPVPQAPQVRRG